MAMRLSKAPVLASALAVVVATAGYAFSQGNGWDIGSDGVAGRQTAAAQGDADGMVGPPMPEPSPAGVTAGSADTTASETDVPGWDGAIPDIALSLMYGPDFDPDDLDLKGNGAGSTADPESAVEPDKTEVAAEDDDSVRVIDLPARDDPEDVGKFVPYPVNVAAGQADVTENSSDTNAEPEGGDEPDAVQQASVEAQQVAPIPAPVSQRPPPPPMSPDVGVVEPVRSVSVDPMLHEDVPASWPRRLDQINARRGVEDYVAERVDPRNLFMSDWVEVRTQFGTHIVPK